MADYRSIYRFDADRYDRMVSAEDVDGNVIATLASLLPLSGAKVVEVGVGTGRMTRQLIERGAEVRGVEPEPAMLAIAKAHVAAQGANPDRLCIGTLEALPSESAGADLGVAGWVFGHQRSFEPVRWRDTVGAGIAELERAVKPGGVIVLFETLGTGVPSPGVRDDLAELQAHFEAAHGFERRVLRTDYAFANAEEAATSLEFFFGAAMARTIRENDWARVPEWTGAWVKHVSDA